jgi:Reverse transcriptase (RNA-dependent DNA polymerase)
MTLLPGYKKECDATIICKLNKLIYELKQSPQTWYEKLSSYLTSCNFQISSVDHSLFSKMGENCVTNILVYVDDIIITGDNLEEIKRAKVQLKENFNIKDLGLLKYFLGIEIARSPKGLFISQRKYALNLLKETEKLGCKPVSTPIDSKYKLNTEDGEPLNDINYFQRLVGRLIYLTVTRLDISYSVSQISKFMHALQTTHVNVIDRILRYLKGTPRKGIWIKNNKSNDVCGYSDADWAGSFDQKINNRFLHICGRKFSHMEEQEIKCRGSIECQSGISSHDINHERIDLDQATFSGYWN